MRITFANEAVARAAAGILEQYGYAAEPVGRTLETDCPPLLAVPVVGRTVGLHQVEDVRLATDATPSMSGGWRFAAAGGRDHAFVQQ